MATGNLSTGQIIGGFIGGVIGAYFGGPWGAVLGASIGMTIGGWIDPPDIDYEKPDKSDLSLNKADEAIPLPDVLGTTKLGGNVIAYWGNWADAQKQRVEGGGKGGSESITTGYKYYLTWEVGVAEGPVETFQTMFKNNDMLWYNGMTAPDQGLGDNIWLRYKFDDKSSSSTDDAGPYDADGILTGSPPFTSGKSGGAKIFNGSSQNLTVDMPSNFGDVFRDEFSIAFWYKNPNIYHGKSVFWTRRREYVGYWKVMDQIEISFYSNQCNVVYKCNGALQSGWLRVYNVLVADGNWHHLVFSFNSDYIKGYKDGISV